MRPKRQAFYRCSDIADFPEAMEKATEEGIKSWATEDSPGRTKSLSGKKSPRLEKQVINLGGTWFSKKVAW